MEMDIKFLKQPPTTADGKTEKFKGITSISQKQKGGKSLGIPQIYELNHSTICLVRNKKKPSAQIFLWMSHSGQNFLFYGRKLYVIMVSVEVGLLESFKIHLSKCLWCAIKVHLTPSVCPQKDLDLMNHDLKVCLLSEIRELTQA